MIVYSLEACIIENVYDSTLICITGRDDRIISDHGREARFPFLDENLATFLSALPVWRKADMRYPRGIGMRPLALGCIVTYIYVCGMFFIPCRSIVMDALFVLRGICLPVLVA